MIEQAVLDALGVTVAGVSEREIRAYCPVHHLVKGRADNHPSWYMNRATGAWICFSCQQRGSLYTLVHLMGADPSIIDDVPSMVLKAAITRWNAEMHDVEDTPEPEAADEGVYVSEYAFSRNPFPPKFFRQQRDITKDLCAEYNVRWDREGACFLLPVYNFDGVLMGWQEKSNGYFKNVPDGLRKRESLFGFQLLGGAAIVVESPLDVVRLARHGIRGGVATYGSYVSDEQLDALTAATDEILLAFDNDVAGHEATDQVRRRLRKRSIVPKVIAYPKKRHGKDPGEWPAELLWPAIKQASTLIRKGAIV